jgi:hypothetical protein
MNRMFVLVAAGLLGTGCVSSDVCDAHTVWVGWPSFVRTVAGGGYQTTASCADVDHLEVFVDTSTTPYRAFCNDNEVPVQLLTGDHTLTVEAIGADGFPFLRDVVSVNISDSCVDRTVSTQPGEGWVTVNYAFPGGGGCAASPSYMWFNVHDDVAGLDIAGVNAASANPRSTVCNATNLPRFPLPAGDFTLDWIEEVFDASGGLQVAGAFCSGTLFSVNSGVSTSVGPVAIADSTSFCPGTAP